MRQALRIEYLALVLLACSSSGPKRVANPSEFIARGKVFTGPDEVLVEIVELKADRQALLKVSGTRSDVDGKVLEYEVQEDGRYLRYSTQVHGRTRNTLVRVKDRFKGDPTWTLYLGGGVPGPVKVSYDKEASGALDTVKLYREYEDQKADGSLEALQRFDREGEERQADEKLAKERERLEKACGFDMPMSVAWDTVDDEFLKERSITSYCGPPLSAMRQLCKSEPAKAFFKEKVSEVKCRLGDKLDLQLAGKTMTWTTHVKGMNQDQFAREAVLGLKHGKKTLQYHIKLADTKVCADSKASRYIVLAPDGAEEPGLLYGDGKEFTRARTSRGLSDGWFYEPRFYNKRNNESFRGLNLRSWSRVEIDDKKGNCTLVCGTHETKLELLDGETAAKIAGGAKIKPDPLPREPYALARDRRGTYYYVDRSTKPGEERFFQLYVGRLGNVKKQKMKDIVSDSEGEIFSSKTGDLRLILDKSEATWINKQKRQSKSRTLRLVPVQKNLQMIYNNLGVYTGKRLGTPCDDYGAE